MAKGRFVSKQITIDKKVNDLKDPWSMLGFTWMIPHADCEGRLYGDPAVLKSIIFPRQNGNISVEEVEKMACDWHNAGLIIYYEDDCDRYIQLVNFEKHQTGLRKDREPVSIIPGFNPDKCRIVDGLNRVKLSLSEVKDKLSEVEVKDISPCGDKPDPVYEPFNNQADMPQSFVDEYKPKKPAKKPKKQPDPRYTHIAYSAFYSITKRRPAAILVDEVISIIGDNPDIDRLRKCYVEWCSRGYNPNSIKWLDWYSGGITGQNNGAKTIAEKNDEFLKSQMAEEMEKINNGD